MQNVQCQITSFCVKSGQKNTVTREKTGVTVYAWCWQGSICISGKNSPYYCQKSSQGVSLASFLWLQYKKFCVPTKLRSTLKYKFWMQEKANPHDNADAYRGDLTHYCAKSSYFKEILPYQHSAYKNISFYPNFFL